MLVCFICVGTQDRILIDINHHYDESAQKLNIKIEYKYICKSTIFTVSAAYLFKSFCHISFLDKEIAKISFYPRAAHDYFLFHPAGG